MFRSGSDFTLLICLENINDQSFFWEWLQNIAGSNQDLDVKTGKKGLLNIFSYTENFINLEVPVKAIQHLKNFTKIGPPVPMGVTFFTL